MRNHLFLACGILVHLTVPLWAEVRVEGNSRELTFSHADYEARFVKEDPQTGASYGWTLATLKYKDRDLIVEAGANGAAMRRAGDKNLPDAGFIGSRHGREDIRKIVVIVDGKEHSAEEPLSLSGKRVELLKESVVGPFEQVSRIALDDLGLREESTFKPLEDTSEVDVFYPFMHCFSKTFGEWVTGSSDGVLSAGQFTDDDSFSNLGRLKWTAVFSPTDGYGAVVSYGEDYVSRSVAVHRFWNRRADNKLYFWPPTPNNETVQFVARVAGFEATADSWTGEAEAVEEKLAAQGGQ